MENHRPKKENKLLGFHRFLRGVVAILSGIAIYSACPAEWHPAATALATGLGAAFCMHSLLGLPLAVWTAHTGLGVPWYLSVPIYMSPIIFYWLAVLIPEGSKDGAPPRD